MKSVQIGERFAVGNIVAWVSLNGNHYTGKIVEVLESGTCNGDLCRVEVAENTFRRFYDNQVDAHIIVEA